MEKEHTLKEKARKKLQDWKLFAEELNNQLQLGISETKEEFEKQKENLRDWLDDFSERLKNARDISKESIIKVKSSLEELRVQAALGKAETEDKLKDQQRNLAHAIHDLRHNISSVYEHTREGSASFFEEVGDTLEDYHTRFDLFRLQMHLGKSELKEEWEEKKTELDRKLSMIKAKLHGAEENATGRWKDFTSEMKEAWHHFKKAFSEKSEA